MKKITPLFSMLLLSVSLIAACHYSKTQKIASESENVIEDTKSGSVNLQNASLYSVLDSFAKVNGEYFHCIPTVGYLKVLKSNGNDELKLLLASFEINSSNLKKLYFDEVLTVNYYRFFLDRDTGNDMGKNLGRVLKNETWKNRDKRGCGSERYWLVHLSGKQLDTISYRATGLDQVPCMDCNEWGDLSRTFVKRKNSDSLDRILGSGSIFLKPVN